MTDARYADADPAASVAIRAEDADDLRILAALAQDAVLTVADMPKPRVAIADLDVPEVPAAVCDAAVGSLTITKMTDANGVATTTLRTGSTAGQIVVSATSGSFRSVTVVTVAGSSAAPSSA